MRFGGSRERGRGEGSRAEGNVIGWAGATQLLARREARSASRKNPRLPANRTAAAKIVQAMNCGWNALTIVSAGTLTTRTGTRKVKTSRTAWPRVRRKWRAASASKNERTSASTFRTVLCQYIPNSGGLQYLKTSRPEDSIMSKQTEPPDVVARWLSPSANTSRFVPWPAASV